MRLKRQLVQLYALALAIALGSPAFADSPFVGGWGLAIPGGGAGWLGVTEQDGKLSASVMWGGGSVVPVDSVKVEGDSLLITRISRWTERDSAGNRVRKSSTQTITAKREGDSLAMTTRTVRDGESGEPKTETFTGKRLPPLPKPPDLSKIKLGAPILLLRGNTLDGWRLTDPHAANGWRIENGELINDPVQTEGAPPKHYGNLRTDREFEDLKLTLDVNVPKGGNSGVYLRGIYEVQVADTFGKPADAHNMGGVYSRIKPLVAAEKPAGEWQAMEITLVDRHVTVVLNGAKIIDNQPVLGPTGGALWADVTRPGPIYLQGDHAAVKYRNIVLRPVLK